MILFPFITLLKTIINNLHLTVTMHFFLLIVTISVAVVTIMMLFFYIICCWLLLCVFIIIYHYYLCIILVSVECCNTNQNVPICKTGKFAIMLPSSTFTRFLFIIRKLLRCLSCWKKHCYRNETVKKVFKGDFKNWRACQWKKHRIFIQSYLI